MNPNRVQMIMRMSKAAAFFVIRKSEYSRYLDSDSMKDIVSETILRVLLAERHRPGGKISWRVMRLTALQAMYTVLGWPDKYNHKNRFSFTTAKMELLPQLPDKKIYTYMNPFVAIAKKRLAFNYHRLTKLQQDALIDWFLDDGYIPGQNLVQIRGKCNGTITKGRRGWYDSGQCRDGQSCNSLRMQARRRAKERRMLRRKCQEKELCTSN